MYYNTNSFGYQSSSRTAESWDCDTVLHLIHPDRNSHRCTGYAPSKRRRCMNVVGSFGSGRAMLSALSTKSISEAVDSPDLERAAELTLCYLHKGQAGTVSQQWRALLRAEASEKRTKAQSPRSPKTEPAGWSRPQFNANKTTGGAKVKKEEPESNFCDDATDVQWDAIRDALRRMDLKLVDLEALLENLKRAQGWQEKERCEEESRERVDRDRKEKEKREQEARKEAERTRREQAEREQAARDEEERARKKREAREAELRERTRLAREKREKEAKEKAAREAEDWAQAWKRYSDGWEKIKVGKSGNLPENRIPWPVKSGLYTDVTVGNVKLFFEKAPPEELVGTAEKRFRLASLENLRWHTDKIQQQFGADILHGRRKEIFNTVSSVMIELRQVAHKNRRS